MDHSLSQLKQRHRQGEIGGMVSVCSSHPIVLRTALRMAREEGVAVLVEATANQVNQFGGYTGWRPADFARIIGDLALETGISGDQVIIGADHLGPHAWKHERATAAMQKCEDLVRHCVQAGFQKLHLDTGVRCADDPGPDLPLDLTVERAARLCRVAEEAGKDSPRGGDPLYVIGNEVPAPGGALKPGTELDVSDPGDVMASVDAYARAFTHAGVADAWQRVLAVVVQPGVDFGDFAVAPYRPQRAAALSAAHDRLPGIMTYEIHAADYQLPQALRRMIEDRFMLLKVGPCLTFALRQALYALSDIEAALPRTTPAANLKQVMEQLMTSRPDSWQSGAAGSPEELFYLRHYSLRDRIRYYWSLPEAQTAVRRLIQNLKGRIPAALLHQYLPDLYPHIQSGERPVDPQAIIANRIRQYLQPYLRASAGAC